MPFMPPSATGQAMPPTGMAVPGGQQPHVNPAMRQMPMGMASSVPTPMSQMSMGSPGQQQPSAPPPQSAPQPQMPALNNMQAANAVTKLQNPFAPKGNSGAPNSNRMVQALFSQPPNKSNGMS